MTANPAKPDLSALYQDTQSRLAALVAGLDARALATPVPACPGWTVQDVVAHELAVTEDALAGRLTGPPDEEQTAAQVARFRGHDIADMLASWAVTAPQFAELAAAFEVWPAVIDIVSHEQDIRGAIGRPGARDTEAVRVCADVLITYLAPPVPVRVTVENTEFRVGPDGADGRPRPRDLPVRSAALADGPPQPVAAGRARLVRRSGPGARSPGDVRPVRPRHRGVTGPGAPGAPGAPRAPGGRPRPGRGHGGPAAAPCSAAGQRHGPGPGYFRAALGFLTFGGSVLTWAKARCTQPAARPGSSRQAPGRLA